MIRTVKMTEMTMFAKPPKYSSTVNPTVCPRKVPATETIILPEKYAEKNFIGLYFANPRGITTGSSGIGHMAAKNGATIPIFRKEDVFMIAPSASTFFFFDKATCEEGDGEMNCFSYRGSKR